MSRSRLDAGAWSWALFEWARNPYVILCGIFVMAPYITTTVIGDPVRGQELLSRWHTISGVTVALTAPFLGAAADRMGRRKPMLAAILALMLPAIALQWFALPGEALLPLWAIGTMVIVAGFSFAWTEVLHNAMLTSASTPPTLARVSGLGLALGNLASLLLLLFVMAAFALPGRVDWPFVPSAPLFGLDPAAFEPSRIVAPLTAAWLLVFAIPLFLYTRDLDTSGERFFDAMRNGVGNVTRTLRKLRDHRNIAAFLLARMLYADGKIAILIFSGVYAAGVMSWDLVEMLAYGIVLSTFAVFGGAVAGWMDDRFGPKGAVSVTILVTLACLLTMVSMAPGQILFVIAIDPGALAWSGPIFQTLPELLYLAASMLIAVSITAAFAASRTMMARLSPSGMEGELFGLYALSSSATAWLAPLLVERFTATFDSQRAGFSAIGLLLVVGFAVLMFVRSPEQRYAALA